MKIVDCFIFYNELDLLSLRLKELYDVVDWFVIVEGTLTHDGREKPLYYLNNKMLYGDYLDKIVHVVVDDMPTLQESDSHRDREFHQRRSITRGLDGLNLNDDDIVTVCDVDELINNELLLEIKKHGLNIYKDNKNSKYKKPGSPFKEDGTLFTPLMDMFYYNFECKAGYLWSFPKILTYGRFNSLEDVQSLRSYDSDGEYLFGGWHMSYFGDIDFIINKIQSIAHSEFHTDKYKDREYIRDKVVNKIDLFERGHEKWQYVPIEGNSFLPKNYNDLL